MRAVALGYQGIVNGDSEIAVVGGQESMSMAPHCAHLRGGVKMGGADDAGGAGACANERPAMVINAPKARVQTNVPRITEMPFLKHGWNCARTMRKSANTIRL